MTRKDLHKLSATRLGEAKVLLSAGASDGAYYLAGYAVECALKACIAKSTERHEFPDKRRAISSFTHNFKDLISVAGLKIPFDEAMRQSEFASFWDVVSQWSEDSRYLSHSAQEARDLIIAIEDKRHGILQWLRKRY